MAVRLVRKASETPNITNRDDVKMVRYAYGGYNGIVKNYGGELLPSFSGGELHLGTGRIVLQGWEVDIDGDGWGFISSISSGSQYYAAYLELSLITETAEIKTTYKTGSYPEIDPGDDLTQFPSGTARLPLCQFQVVNGKIAEANRVAPVIPYLIERSDDLDKKIRDLKDGTTPPLIAQYASSDLEKGTIEERLTKHEQDFGFSEIQLTPPLSDISMFRQGKIAFLRFNRSKIFSGYSFYIMDVFSNEDCSFVLLGGYETGNSNTEKFVQAVVQKNSNILQFVVRYDYNEVTVPPGSIFVFAIQ